MAAFKHLVIEEALQDAGAEIAIEAGVVLVRIAAAILQASPAQIRRQSTRRTRSGKPGGGKCQNSYGPPLSEIEVIAQYFPFPKPQFTAGLAPPVFCPSWRISYGD